MPIVADILALALVGWKVWRGWNKGLVRSLAGLAQGIVVYLGAWMLGRPLAHLFSSGDEPGVKALVAGFLLGVILMVVVTAISSWAILRHLRKRPDTRTDEERRRGEQRDRIGGACFGGLTAVLLVAFLAWVYALLGIAAGPSFASIDGSATAALSRTVMRPLLYPFARRFTSEPATAALAARALSDPATTSASARQLARNPDVAALAHDRAFGKSVLDSDKGAILANASFRRIFEDGESVECLRRLGWLSAGEDGEKARNEMAERLALAGANVRKLRDDPEVQSVLTDPELKRRADAGDIIGLLDDPRVRRIVGRVLSTDGK